MTPPNRTQTTFPTRWSESIGTLRHKGLCSLLRHRPGNTCDAADLAQDIYLQLIRKAYIPSAEECRRHLMQIAKGKLIDLYRRCTLEAHYFEPANPPTQPASPGVYQHQPGGGRCDPPF
ncbi:sigma factor [Aeromonas caviae]|uniref:sigma factor n=1 Tax=Aeromonas TaxID=642 RepID=UPI0009BA5B37|nr:sigma factor [Aeromonas caviae]MDH1994765.1 hypothetical protein [Aeromonas caviae]BDN93122.1 hypothetical protein KAM497c_26660 [Aeromonas caviae]GJA16253.1 hypothetical protein KAM335_34490 [Aeromonas caviae]GJA25003.1 hypothetical protein KAM337_35310 [Aeromonas caviae]GJB21666.1 hypothetical protein KAM364_35780 [Aeromonas caviae]